MSGQEPDGGSVQGSEAPSDRRPGSLRLLVSLASLIAGALGLVATFLTLIWFNGGLLEASGWWSLLWLVAAGAIAAAIDRHLRSYFLAVGGALVTVLAYIVWYFQFHEPTGFDFLWPVIPLLVLIVAVPAVLLGWLPVHLALKARARGSRRAWVPLAGGLAVLMAAATASAALTAPESAGQSEPIGAPAPFSATVTVTVGTKTVTYPDGDCSPMHGMTLRAGDHLANGVGLSIPSDGGGKVVVYGAIRGVAWEITENPQWTFNGDGSSGTFSGKDAISGADVMGIFACK